MKTILDKAKELFNKRVLDFSSDPYGLIPHVEEAERLANFMLKKHPEADKEIVILAVRLHDIGHYPITSEDHAVVGEKIAINFLKTQNLNPEKIKAVAHCIRAHRCKDVMPETIEAKIVAFVDSASHMTSTMYLDMIKQNKSKDKVLGKIERDFRDLGLFPEIKENMREIYEAWKKLIEAYKKIDLN